MEKSKITPEQKARRAQVGQLLYVLHGFGQVYCIFKMLSQSMMHESQNASVL